MPRKSPTRAAGRGRSPRSKRPPTARARRPAGAAPRSAPEAELERDPRAVLPELLFRRCDLSHLGFDTTEDLPPFDGVLGQARAEAALAFGLAMPRDGFNLYALGADGTGRHFLVRHYVERSAATRSRPQDWCYVFDFAEPNRPRALALPAGRGAELKREMAELVEAVTAALAAAFQSEEFQTRREVIDQEAREHQEQALATVAEEARHHDLAAVRTPMGVVFAPVLGGEVATPDVFEKLANEEKQRFAEAIEEAQAKLQRLMRQQSRWQAERRSKLQALRREVTRFAVEPLIDEVRTTFADLPVVLDYLAAVQADIEAQAKAFLAGDTQAEEEGPAPAAEGKASLRRYHVNLFVDNSRTTGAPVLAEDSPSFPNLLGRIEHQSQMGNLVTDFTLIRPGALHRANGGFLVLDALQVLRQPYAWEGLKRSLETRRLRIEPLAQVLGFAATTTLEPEPIPLDVKVVLVGDRSLYYMLSAYDPDFARLFKVAADFEEELERSAENETRYAALVARLAREEKLRPFARAAVERVLEQASRLAGDRERLSLHTSAVVDLMREADLLAGDAPGVGAGDVDRAIGAQIFRQDRLRERVMEGIGRGLLLVATEGAVVGQVNGLVVLQLGGFSFGHPARITARVRLGEGEVVNIEREVELSGPLHSKGVLILTGFLGERFARQRPLALAASLVLEQSYGGVDGDSASLAELCALLSAIAGVPISQALAMTGSVDQRGQAQPIGGVNEKIEGFFDACRLRGGTGPHGVIVPQSNLQHLALRRDVVEAVERGTFQVFGVRDVDEAIELLTGLPAGRRGDDGLFPEGTFNRLVDERLAELAQLKTEQAAPRGKGKRR